MRIRTELDCRAFRLPYQTEPVQTGQRSSAAQSGLFEAWMRVLERAQRITNAMARGTRIVIEPLERRGWGDELLVYARRMAE